MVRRFVTRALLASINSASICISKVALSDYESQTGELDTAGLSRRYPHTYYEEYLWILTGESYSLPKE